MFKMVMKLHEIIIDLSETRLKFMPSERRFILISKLELNFLIENSDATSKRLQKWWWKRN